jgi:hypothetical protein
MDALEVLPQREVRRAFPGHAEALPGELRDDVGAGG